MFNLQIATFFVLLQFVAPLATTGEDECITSTAKALAGNCSEHFLPVLKGISRNTQARGVLPGLSTSQIDNLIEPGAQRLYDQVYHQAVAQLTSLGERSTPDALVQASEAIISVVKSTLKEAISTVQMAVPASTSAENPPGSSPIRSAPIRPAIAGRPLAVSTLPLEADGSKPSFRTKRNVRSPITDFLGHAVAASTMSSKTSRALKPSSRFARKRLSFSISDPSNHLVSRTNTPLAVSEIPTSKTFEPVEAPKKVTTERADRKCTINITKDIRVCIPDNSPLKLRRKRSIFLGEDISASNLISISFAKGSVPESFSDHDSTGGTPEINLEDVMSSFDTHLKNFH